MSIQEPRSGSLFCLIPNQLIEDKKLNWQDRAVYGILYGLSNEEGRCFPSNEWLGKKMDLGERAVRDILLKLEHNGYITREIISCASNPFKKYRNIFVHSNFKKCLPAAENCHIDEEENCRTVRQKTAGIIDKKELIDKNKNLSTSENPQVQEVSNYIFKKITSNKSDFTGKQSKNWKHDCAELLKKRTSDQIKSAIDWAVDDAEFWSSIITCPGKLLKHIDTIELKMRTPSKNNLQEVSENFLKNMKERFRLHKQIQFSQNAVEFLRGQSEPLTIKVNDSEFVKKCIDRLTVMKENTEGLCQ